MAPLTKRRWSTRRQGKRRATHNLEKKTANYCPNCREPVRPHCACGKCGFYKGSQVIKIKVKKEKTSK